MTCPCGTRMWPLDPDSDAADSEPERRRRTPPIDSPARLASRLAAALRRGRLVALHGLARTLGRRRGRRVAARCYFPISRRRARPTPSSRACIMMRAVKMRARARACTHARTQIEAMLCGSVCVRAACYAGQNRVMLGET